MLRAPLQGSQDLLAARDWTLHQVPPQLETPTPEPPAEPSAHIPALSTHLLNDFLARVDLAVLDNGVGVSVGSKPRKGVGTVRRGLELAWGAPWELELGKQRLPAHSPRAGGRRQCRSRLWGSSSAPAPSSPEDDGESIQGHCGV